MLRASTLILAASFATAPFAAAATFTVNSVVDDVDAVPGDGLCQTANAVCTLRAAIQEANALAGVDTILLPAGTYTLTIPQPIPGTAVDPEHGDLDITEAVTIDGDGAGLTIIQAGTSLATSIGRVFDVVAPIPQQPVPTEIWDVTIRFGNALPFGTVNCTSGGGAVANRRVQNNTTGAVKLVNSVVTGNVAFTGGALCNESPGALFLLDTTVSGNQATTQGGGVKVNGGQFFSIASTISGNVAQQDQGGGVAVIEGQAEFIDSTVSGNLATRGGGVVNNFATVVMTSTTVTANTATANSGGVISAAGTTSIRHTIIAGNQAPQYPDCIQLTSLGYNVIGVNIDAFMIPCLAAPMSDHTGVDAGLGPLSYNGGPTQTHALLAGSPAIDAGDPVNGCTYGNTPIPDQRGLPRQLTQCDIGAYEMQQVFATPFATVMSNTPAPEPVTFATTGGIFGSLDAVSEADLPQEGKPPGPFPYGFFSWTVTGLTLGQTITVTITYPQPVPVGDYWKVLGDTWTNLTAPILGDNDGDAVLTLTITDGVFPDADGVVNGQISDPGGVAPGQSEDAKKPKKPKKPKKHPQEP